MSTGINENCGLCKAPAEKPRPWDANWDQKCVRSICKLLEFDQEEVSVLFVNLNYCRSCHELIREVDFTVRTLAALQEKSLQLKNKLTKMIPVNFGFYKTEVNADDIEIKEEFSLQLTNVSNTIDPLSNDYLNPSTYPGTHEAEGNQNLRNIATILDDAIEEEEGLAAKHKLENPCNHFAQDEPLEISNKISEDMKPELIVPDSLEYSEDESTCFQSFQSEDWSNQYSSHSFENSRFKEEDRESDKSSDADFNPDEANFDENEVSDSNGVYSPPKSKTENTHRKLSKFTYKYRCGDCQARCRTRAYLDLHQRRFHLNDPKPYRCDNCTESFAHDISLSIHKSKKHAMPNAVCSVCGTGFASKFYLLAHIKRDHPRAEKFDCKTCSVKFFYEQDCKDHEKRHKPGSFTCVFRQCPMGVEKDYGSEDNLRLHVDEHHGETLNCNLCDFQTSCRKSLNVHVLRHSNEKQIICSACPKRFPTNWVLKAHIESVHPDPNNLKTYYCAFCPHKFGTWRAHYDHTRRSHQMKIPKSYAHEFELGKTIDQIKQELPELYECLRAQNQFTETRLQSMKRRMVAQSKNVTKKRPRKN